MKLTFDEIKSVTFGWVEVKEEGGFLDFYKTIESQREAWKRANNDFVYDRARKKTGIKLDFYTDSDFIAVGTDGGQTTVAVDGLFVGCFAGKENYSVRLEAGEKRVTVYLDKHGYTKISSVELSDGATFRAVGHDRKILFMGDSITEGWQSGYDFVSFAEIVSRAFNAESVVNGCGGAYYLPEFAERTCFDPDIVIVAYGTNDYYCYDDFPTVERNARGFLERIVALYGDKKLFVISPIWRRLRDKPKESMGDFPEYCERLKKIYADYPIEVIDGFGLVPHDSAFFAGDDLHPNALGFYVYGENLAREISKRL